MVIFTSCCLTRSIGEHLALMERVHVITGGFYGVGDVVGHSYHERRHQMGRPSNVWHVLPLRDNQVCCQDAAL